MPAVNPYRRYRQVRLNRIRHTARMDETLAHRVPQNGASRCGVASPGCPALGKHLVTKPFQADELPRTLGLAKRFDELDYSRIEVQRNGLRYRVGRPGFPRVADIRGALERHESNHHFASVGIEVAGSHILTNLPAIVHVANAHLQIAVDRRQFPRAFKSRRKRRGTRLARLSSIRFCTWRIVMFHPITG